MKIISLLLIICSLFFLRASASDIEKGIQVSLAINNLKSPDGHTFPDLNLEYLGGITYQITYIANKNLKSVPHEVKLFFNPESTPWEKGLSFELIKSDKLSLIKYFTKEKANKDRKKLCIGMTQSHMKRFGNLYGHPKDLWIELRNGEKISATGWVDYEICDYKCTIFIDLEENIVTLTFTRLLKDIEIPKLNELNPKLRVKENFLTSYVFEGVCSKN